MGSGTTAKAAIQTDRNFLGSEISEDYFKISLKRIE
jgi:DNA modification methylase